jgi:hypothetical protein
MLRTDQQPAATGEHLHGRGTKQRVGVLGEVLSIAVRGLSSGQHPLAFEAQHGQEVVH